MSHYVKIHYGPYEAFHTTSHKPAKIVGVRDKLRRLGYRVDINPVEFIDYCVFEIMGYQVFRCNIRNLLLNMECDSDPVASRAVQACLAASDELQHARHRFWVARLLNEDVFKRTADPDQWPFDLNLKPYATCVDCAGCCGILTRKKSDVEIVKPLIYNDIKQNLLYDLSNRDR
ncbi:uncharacterized protein LOC125226006 [Leguminivora glycinivorella]|uniref:uncharacterized protein LOC125226006 n=1 Tax=Leguminivora glycinivorella TaxID=1035111 RepID=UPI00200EC593|nr:uncharacterized protein LOC125226006 [Leguminivora glycinivorella]